MGISVLYNTEVYQFVSTCIPRESEIETVRIFDEYELEVVPRYMDTLGTMCDYGVRVRFPMHEFGYIEIGMILGRYKKSLRPLVDSDFLIASEAYQLATDSKRKPSQAMYNDYAVLTDRAYYMYQALHLHNPYFGRYFLADGMTHAFECDCASDRTIVDMKVSRTAEHNRKYWTQVLLYSLLARRRDHKQRIRICLLYPAQGLIKWFTYSSAVYAAMYHEFDKQYEKEVLCI